MTNLMILRATLEIFHDSLGCIWSYIRPSESYIITYVISYISLYYIETFYKLFFGVQNITNYIWPLHIVRSTFLSNLSKVSIYDCSRSMLQSHRAVLQECYIFWNWCFWRLHYSVIGFLKNWKLYLQEWSICYFLM